MGLDPAVGAARTDEEEAASEAPLPEEDVSPCITGDDDPDAVEPKVLTPAPSVVAGGLHAVLPPWSLVVIEAK